METEKVERHSKEVEIKMMFMPLPFFPFKYATLCSFLHIRSRYSIHTVYTIYSYLLKTHNRFSLFFSASAYVPVGTNIYVYTLSVLCGVINVSVKISESGRWLRADFSFSFQNFKGKKNKPAIPDLVSLVKLQRS